MRSIVEPTTKLISLDVEYNSQALNTLIRDSTINEWDRKTLMKFNKNKKTHNTFSDEYTFKDTTIGRMYGSIQQIPKEYRNELFGANCVEIDFENCHPRFMLQIGNMYRHPTDAIKNFVHNKAECLKEAHENVATAKSYYLSALYGGDVPTESENLKKYMVQMRTIGEKMKEDKNLEHILKYAVKKFKKDNRSQFKTELASFMAFVLQTIENRCMLTAYDYMMDKGASIKVLVGDGITIDSTTFNFKEHKDDMHTKILEKTGYSVVLGEKPCVYNYKAPEKNYVVVTCERDVLDYLVKHYKHAIKRGADGFYVQEKGKLCYTRGEEGLRTLIKNIDFRKETQDAIVYWSSTTKGMEDIIKYINKNTKDTFPIDENFIEVHNTYTRGRLYYNDKFYDAKTKSFHKITNDTLPIVFINRPAFTPAKITKKQKDEYKQKYLNMFSAEQLEFVLIMMARALLGYRDKNWTIMNGLRNSGKGVFEKIAKHSFTDYCATMELPMTKTHHTGDASQYRYILTSSLHLKRITFTNEVSSLEGKAMKIDGNAIKKFVSGGDAVKCRSLFKEETDVVFNTHIVVNVNSIPDSDPPDAMMTALPIKMPYKFVDKPEDICERPTDYDIKDKITAEDPDIFVAIVLDAFRDAPLSVDDLVADDMEEYKTNLMENITEAPYILNNKLIKDVDGFISTPDLLNIFKPTGMGAVALGRWLTTRMTAKRATIIDEKTKKTKRVRGYGGYSIKKEVDDDVDDDESDVDE